MAYINIIISSHLDVFQSLFLSRYTLILPFFPPSPLSFQRFSIFCGWDGEGGEMLKETGERYTEQQVMNLPAVCNTLRFVGSSLVSDPNLMRQDSFSLSPPTHACTHTSSRLLLPAIAGVVHHPSIFSCLSLSYNPWKLPWSIKDWVVVLEGKHTPASRQHHPPSSPPPPSLPPPYVCVWATNRYQFQIFRHYWSEYSSH